MSTLPDIYFSRGTFLVFSKEHAIHLRKKRIVGQLIGCSPIKPTQTIQHGLPYSLSHYEASIALACRLATFKKFSQSDRTSSEQRRRVYEGKLLQYEAQVARNLMLDRIDQLNKRNIEPTETRIGLLDAKKIKLMVPDLPDLDFSPLNVERMEENEVKSLIKVDCRKMAVFKDLYNRGFYITTGTKFGSDFLVYFGDPVMYHARYAVRIVENIEDRVDLTIENYGELNALHRLCHSSSKIPLFVTYHVSPDDREVIQYWTLRSRGYLTLESKGGEFEKITSLILSPSP